MKINVNKEMLLKSISTADSIVSSKIINTILANCLFNITEDQIEIISTDNEMAIRTRIEAIADAPISFTANGRKFADILKELPNGEVLLNIDDSMLMNIQTQAKEIKGKYSLVITPSDEYPKIPDFNEKDSIEIEQNILKDMIKKVVYAASHDTIKPVFNGIFFTIENKNEITSVATDSRRLSMITKKLDIDLPQDFSSSFIVPLKTIGEVLRLLESTGRCRFSFNDRQCFFKIGNTEIISRVIDGQFPNYKHVIPAEHSIDTVIETKKLIDSVKRVMIFTKEPANKIVCIFNGDTLSIEASTPELGEAEEELNLIENKSNGSMKIGVNAQFLLDSLREIDSFSVKCGLTGQMSPITIIPEDDSSYVSVVMPLQIKSGED